MSYRARVVRGQSHSVTLPGGRVRSYERNRGWYEVRSDADATYLKSLTAYQRIDPDRMGTGKRPTSAEPPPIFEVVTEEEAKAIEDREERARRKRPVEDPAVAVNPEEPEKAPVVAVRKRRTSKPADSGDAAT